MASQLVGMGCTLKTIGGRIVITEVKAGGGAAVSGNVKPYDVLVAVDGVRLSSTDHAKKLLLGAAGTSFVAGLERGGASVHVTIWRGGIQNLAKVEAQRSQGVTSQDRAAASRPLPSADQIRAFSAAALFDECCCPGRAIPLSQKLDLFNLLALRAQELALHMRSERIDSSTRGLPQISQELRAISASCAKIQVTLDCIDVTGADRDYRKTIIKLCEAVASECDDALR
jgi:hypothetical protein